MYVNHKSQLEHTFYLYLYCVFQIPKITSQFLSYQSQKNMMIDHDVYPSKIPNQINDPSSPEEEEMKQGSVSVHTHKVTKQK